MLQLLQKNPKPKPNRLSKNIQFDFKTQNNMSVIKVSVEIQLYLSVALCRNA